MEPKSGDKAHLAEHVPRVPRRHGGVLGGVEGEEAVRATAGDCAGVSSFLEVEDVKSLADLSLGGLDEFRAKKEERSVIL